MKTFSLLGGKHVSRLIPFLVLMNLSVHALAHHPPSTASHKHWMQVQEMISGTVYDFGGPIPGVVVTVKNSRILTKTDENGDYSILASPGDTLVFTYPGYEKVEILYTNQLVIDAELFESVMLEEAVINAGYYSVKDKERTGSISRVTAKEIENQPVNNVLGALQGRVPGLEITPTTGLAGGGFTVRIRGQNSIAAGNEPLYIVDGVPYDIKSMAGFDLAAAILPSAIINPLNTLDPASIESIEILKDADATAIYGSRGANGVILITTKKGKNGQTTFSAEASTSIITTTRMMDLLNTEQYLQMRKQAFQNDGISEYPSTAYDINGTWAPNRYTDWQKEFAGGTAFNQNMRLSTSGGGQFTKFNLGGAFMKETTVFPGNFNYKKTSTFANIKHNSKDEKLDMQFSFQYGLDANNLPSSDLYNTSLSLAPNAPKLYDDNGNLNWENSTWNNPLASLNSTYSNNSRNLITNGQLIYNLTTNLRLKSNFGYTNSNLEERLLNPHTMYNPTFGLTSENSHSYHKNEKRDSWIIEPQLDISYKIGNGKLTLILGGTFHQQNNDRLNILAYGFPNNLLIDNLKAANTILVSDEYKSEYKYIAAYSRVNYTYDKKYIINITGRRDGSSRFGAGNKFANFGAIGAAWLFSEESFLSELSWLDFGKFRASFGTTGNDQIGDYQYLNTYSFSNASYDGNLGLTPTRLYNPNYSWEKNQKKEVALEFSILKNRIHLETAYYTNRSDNLLLGMPLPATTGFSSLNSNLNATVKNAGWEFNIQTSNIMKKNFSWKSTLSLTLPKNELVAFDGLEESTYANRFAIGHSLNIQKLYHYTGINPDTGVFEFEDYNGDGSISSPFDNQYIVDLSPKVLGSINNSIDYNSWSLNFMFQFVQKKGFNEYRRFKHAGALSNQPIGVLNNWSENNPFTDYQILTSGANHEAFVAHSRFNSSSGVISDASFLRLKTASISYKVKMDNHTNCTLFFQGQNLFTLTSFKGGDPEKITGFLPPLTRLLLGIKIDF